MKHCIKRKRDKSAVYKTGIQLLSLTFHRPDIQIARVVLDIVIVKSVVLSQCSCYFYCRDMKKKEVVNVKFTTAFTQYKININGIHVNITDISANMSGIRVITQCGVLLSRLFHTHQHDIHSTMFWLTVTRNPRVAIIAFMFLT